MNLLFACDDNYSMILGTALCSFFENNGDANVYVLDGGISARNKKRLEVLENRYKFTINYIIPDASLFKGLPILKHALW